MNSTIPTYIINLEKREDRRAHIENEFSGRPEFSVHLVKAIEDSVPAVGLYRSLHSIVAEAKKQDLPYVLVCEDDHQFTPHYSVQKFLEHITLLKDLHVDVFLGGVSWFDCGVRAKEELYWVENFTGTQFLVIFSSFYQRILDTPFAPDDIIDKWMAGLSANIFVAVPMLSVQRDFGYSDVTPKNDGKDIVEELFVNTIARWKAFDKIYNHITRSQLIDRLSDDECEAMQLPVYVINLREREDRLLSIEEEFRGRDEFNVHIVDACREANGAIGLWKSIKKAVRLAKEREDEVILICEDDHIFCDAYNKRLLFSAIYQGAHLGADIILGGISRTGQVIAVNDYLCWIDSFQCTQFTVIYDYFFDAILEEEFSEDDAADLKLSQMTPNKYVIHPFISVQRDFGYSDIPIDDFGTDQYRSLFDSCEKRIDVLRQKAGQFTQDSARCLNSERNSENRIFRERTAQ